MGVCYIISGGMSDFARPDVCPEDFVIAADSGYTAAVARGMVPDLTVGDFDSVSAETVSGPIERHPSRKDRTDTALALDIALSRSYGEIVILGALGGRVDHSIANLQLLQRACEAGARAKIVSTSEEIFLVKNGEVEIPAKGNTGFSVFSYTPECTGVCESGVEYPLENARLTFGDPLGVSNEFAGDAAVVSVKNGTLLIVVRKNSVSVAKKEY